MPTSVLGVQITPEGDRGGAPRALSGDAESMSVAEFIAALRSLKIAAGNPSFHDLERFSGVPRSTLADALSHTRRAAPRWDVVAAFVQACGGSAELRWWRHAWAAVKQNADIAGRPAVARRRAAGGAARIVPRQLPPTIEHFTGRREQFDTLSELATRVESPTRPAGAGVVAVVSGPAGIGKSALAVHWAQQNADRFPDGQLYLDLRGSVSAGVGTGASACAVSYEPRSPDSVVRPLLESLVAPGVPIPSGPAAQAALYRSRLAGTRTLLVIDGAQYTDQVRPLLPASAGCFTIVISRRTLTELVALDGAAPIPLSALTEAEARALLSRRLGTRRVHEDPAAADRLIDRCARQPLELNLVIARGLARPQASLDELLDETDPC